MRIYPTDLTDYQWSKIVNFFTLRKRKHPLRSIFNGLLYLTKTGVQWKSIPSGYYFRKWASEGLIEEIHKFLVGYFRKQKKRKETYSYNARKPGVKEQIVELTLNSSGVRDIGRILGINKNTVVSELKKIEYP